MHHPLRLGVPATREGVIHDVTTKSGRSGSLAFVTVRYQFLQEGVLCLEEEQDIVYREPGEPIAAPAVQPFPEPASDVLVQDVAPDSRLLFRFSALTFNAHRIHYDRDYAVNEEGYPGLVVHGPLTAMLLVQLAERAEQHRANGAGGKAGRISSFSFRGLAPLFDGAPFRLQARYDAERYVLEAIKSDGETALRAEARFSE